MIRWFPLLPALLFASQTCAATARTEDDQLEIMVRAEMFRAAVPGLTFALTESGRITQQGAFGSLIHGEPAVVTLDTPMQIGSLTKSITAVAVLQLVETRRFALDDPIAPILGLAANHPLAQVTIRHLLSHTSGISTLQGNAFQNDRSMDSAALESRARRLLELHPQSPPGAHWAYSNANYLLLGFLVETVMEEDFGCYLDARIFRPLGMESSWVIGGECGGSERTAVIGHRPWFGSRRPLSNPLSGRGSGPQGGVISTAPDMARFFAMLVNGEDDLLRAENKRLLWQPASGSSPRYGMGWFVDSASGQVQHAGSSPGFEAFAVLEPDTRRAAVVLINANSGFGFGETLQLRQSVTAMALGQSYYGERRPWGRQLAFIALLLLPVGFMVDGARCARRIWTCGLPRYRRRTGSWWPLAIAAVIGWLLLLAVPRLFGAFYSTLMVYQPDLALMLAAAVGCAALWAIVRSLASSSKPTATQISARPADPA